VLCLGTVLLKAIKNIDPCDDATLGGDCYYEKYDSAFAAASDRIRDNNAAVAQAEQPVLPINESLSETFVSTNAIFCAPVVSSGSVSQAIKDANNGIWPPKQFDGLDMLVSIDHQGKRIIRTLGEALKASDLVFSGDQVCISINRVLLEQH
jgi:hypothetical protein